MKCQANRDLFGKDCPVPGTTHTTCGGHGVVFGEKITFPYMGNCGNLAHLPHREESMIFRQWKGIAKHEMHFHG
ncbi:MAG: hypothetical protein C4576_17635 [Desulfobacteraceae bacterium]|nr:MAG: hypothetical protein C4576_17635 [Desulfobacteraceae bacterium]